MKKEIFIHLAVWIIFFALLSLVKNYLSLSYWPFWLGGLVGVFLPDIDRVIHTRFIKTEGLVLQKDLIFHSVLFQIIFFVLTFFVLSTSSSTLARGLVISFSTHLIIDEIIELTTLQNFDNWMNLLPFRLDLRQAKIYVGAIVFLVCIISFLM